MGRARISGPTIRPHRFFIALLLLAATLSRADPPTTAQWTHTEGAAGGGRFSPLTDVTRENVAQLHVAWTYEHQDFWEGNFPVKVNGGTSAESTPIVVDGRLFVTTPANRVIALDPETGRELWTFDPQLDRDRAYANMYINRGVAYWADPAANGACAARVFLATLDARLIALDAATGTAVQRLRRRRRGGPARGTRARARQLGVQRDVAGRGGRRSYRRSVRRSPTCCAPMHHLATCARST